MWECSSKCVCVYLVEGGGWSVRVRCLDPSFRVKGHARTKARERANAQRQDRQDRHDCLQARRKRIGRKGNRATLRSRV